MRLTLADRIADGTQDAKLECRPPSSGTKVRDAAGNDADGFTGGDAVAVSVTPDTTAPMLAAAAVDGARLTLTFDEPLDEGSVPAPPGGFTVAGHTVTGVAVWGATVTLTMAQGVLPGDAVTLVYAKPSTPLRDRAVTPNEVAGFTTGSGGVPAVVNGTATLEGLAANDNGEDGNDQLKSRRLELKLGYGLSAFGDRFTWTPEVGLGLSDTGRGMSLGWRLVRGGSGGDGGAFELSSEARRRESANDDTPPEHTVGLRLMARF